MDSRPDPAVTNSPNINSVLKPPKPRVPLKDLMAAVPEEDNTAARKRRVSFANVNKIKEFSAGAESMVVCQTPAYEEPFSISSDSSYPSGVDGCTPAKGQPSVPGKPQLYLEKENMPIQSLQMSSGMDLTSVVGNSVRNTRCSVNGMDLTEVANSCETYIDQQTRFSLGMDLTKQSSQSTRYSISGMDLTSTAHPDQVLVDHRSRFSMGMDFTNIVDRSGQSTRYSVNRMDLTEAVNPHNTFLDQRSARFSVGMDMTSVIDNHTNTMRYSCNEMDLTEAAKPYCYQKQSFEGSFPVNVSPSCVDDSDALEFTEAIGGVQLSAVGVSPKYKTSDVGLAENVLYSVNKTRHSVNGMDMTSAVGSAENVLYSVNKTRHSVNGMDMTSAVGSHISSGRRKSSRYSLVNMDLTGIKDNSCDDLEFTQVIGDPRIKAGSTRNSVCEMDLTESIVDEGVTKLSPDNIDHSSNSDKQLEYSADTESFMNVTKSVSNNLNPPISDKVDILPNQSLNLIGAPTTLTCENPEYVDSKLSNVSLCAIEFEPMPSVISHHLITNENKHNCLGNTKPQVIPQHPFNNEIKHSHFENTLPEHPVINENEHFHLENTNPRVSPEHPVINENEDNRLQNTKPGVAHEHPVTDGNEHFYLQKTTPRVAPEHPVINENECDGLEKTNPAVSTEHPVTDENEHLHLQKTTLGVTSQHRDIYDNEHNNLENTLSEVNPDHAIINEHNLPQNTTLLNNSQTMKHGTCGNLLSNESTPEECYAMKNSNKGISLLPEQEEVVERKILNGEGTCKQCINIETVDKLEISVDHASNEDNKNKNLLLNAPKCNDMEQNNVDTLNESLNFDRSNFEGPNSIRLSDGNLECNPNRTENTTQHDSCMIYKEDSVLKNESINKEPISDENISNEVPMDVSITGDIGSEELKLDVTVGLHSPEIEYSEKSPTCPDQVCGLGELTLNMSTQDCSLIEEVMDVGNNDEQVKVKNGNDQEVVSVPGMNEYKINHESNRLSFIQKQNHLLMVEHVTEKDQSIELNASPNTSLNLSSRSVLSSKNITMTRGRNKSLITTPKTPLEISNRGSRIVENEETLSIQNKSVISKSYENCNGLNYSDNSLKHEISHIQSENNHKKGGKRSFETALEPENDTEESPIKQLCLSREDPSADIEILNNVTAPSFLMDTSNDGHETTFGQDVKPTIPAESNLANISSATLSLSACETKQEFSLRVDDSLMCNVPENPLCREVIDLCESTFEATSTEVRELINNSRYKTRNVCADEAPTKHNESFDCLPQKIDCLESNNQSFEQPDLTRGSPSNNSFDMDIAIGTNIFGREVESMCTDPITGNFIGTQLKSSSRRKREKVLTLGNNSYAADFIPKFIKIHFSMDPFGNVNCVSFHNICSGEDTVIGEYLLKQARNYELPEKGSDLILQLQSANKLYLACLARSLNIICKYLNGSITGDILTLEVASCKNHIWTFIDVNIKHPQYLNQSDITISKQKIGELKLSYVRKVFNSIDNNQDQLLNFAKAMAELQYNN